MSPKLLQYLTTLATDPELMERHLKDPREAMASRGLTEADAASLTQPQPQPGGAEEPGGGPEPPGSVPSVVYVIYIPTCCCMCPSYYPWYYWGTMARSGAVPGWTYAGAQTAQAEVPPPPMGIPAIHAVPMTPPMGIPAIHAVPMTPPTIAAIHVVQPPQAPPAGGPGRRAGGPPPNPPASPPTH